MLAQGVFIENLPLQMSPASSADTVKSRITAVVRVASGNFLEMYDFMVFGYYAAGIGRAFFPARSDYASLMLSFMTFGTGYLMRPLGALILGSYMDRHGRRKGLLLTFGMMAFGTLAIGCLPGYESIGMLAPILVVLARLIQGLSAGVELGGTSVYLAEIATPGRRGFYTAWQSGSQQVAVMFAAVLGLILSRTLQPEQMAGWGWRVPLLLGSIMIPFVVMMRRSLQETGEFLARKHRPATREILATLASHWRLVVLGMMLSTTTTVTFYVITAYMPTYGTSVLKLSATTSMLVTLIVGFSNFILVPSGGYLSDRFGRRPMLATFSIIALLTAYPALLWLTSAPSFGRLLTVALWFSMIFGGYNGSMVALLTEIMPAKIRASGFSLAFALAAGLFGGFTPAVSTYLIHVTGNRAMPGLWVSFGALLGLTATALISSRDQTAEDAAFSSNDASSDRAAPVASS
jgi:MFS transporter, MHS family, citrate/tricarballylate:H+ symporter